MNKKKLILFLILFVLFIGVLYYYLFQSNKESLELSKIDLESRLENKSKPEGISKLKTFYINRDTMLLAKDNPHIIDCHWNIDDNVTLRIEKGSELLISKDCFINNYGVIIAEGSVSDSIKFLPKEDEWGGIFNYGSKDQNAKIDLEYCYLYEGFFRCKSTNANLSNCTFLIDSKSLIVNNKRSALVWTHLGNFNMNNCYLENKKVSTGEGMNLNKCMANVTNSVFVNMSDAVEFIDVYKGEISENLIVESPDDAIDLNGCSNLLIKNNILINNKDKAISIGTEEYGPSLNILVDNNLIIGNKIGVSVKDSSFAIVKNTSFIGNKKAVEAYLKNNYNLYDIGGDVKVSECIFVDNEKDLNLGKASNILVRYSLSDKKRIKGKGNQVQEIKFSNTKEYDYSNATGKGVVLDKLPINRLRDILDR